MRSIPCAANVSTTIWPTVGMIKLQCCDHSHISSATERRRWDRIQIWGVFVRRGSGRTVPFSSAAPNNVGIDLGAVCARIVEGGCAIGRRQLRIGGQHVLDTGASLAHPHDHPDGNGAVADTGGAVPAA